MGDVFPRRSIVRALTTLRSRADFRGEGTPQR
jgi:hypothetical protein